MKTRRSGRNRINENQKITLTLGQLKRLIEENSKANEARDAENIHKVKEFLDTHLTFYTKKLQFNNFYPIDKYVWDEEEQKYRNFAYKTKDWGVDWDNDSLATILVKNHFIVSPDEFMDEKHWDDEGCELIGYNPWASSSDDTVRETCCGKIRESRKTGLTMNQLRRLVRESSDGAYTAHVYDDIGNPVEYSELNCAVFVSLEEAKREARKYLAKNGGIIDISFDSEENEDPVFVWSSEDDD